MRTLLQRIYREKTGKAHWPAWPFLMITATFMVGEVLVSHAETVICGSITANSVWSAGASPFIVTCPIVVPKGVMLTIQPGVQVRFKRRLSLKVDGALVAQGTEPDPVLFTSNAETPYPGDWGGVSFSEHSVPATYDEADQYRGGSVLQFAIFQFGGSSGRVGLLEIRGPGPYIEHVVIQKNAASAIMIDKGTVRIRRSLLQSNSNSQAFGGGILAFSSTVFVEDSMIRNNPTSGSGGGVHVADSSVVIRNSSLVQNETAGNGGALFATDSTVSIDQSVFRKNGTPLRGGAVYAARSKVLVKHSLFQDNMTLRSATQGAPSVGGNQVIMGAGLFVTDSELTVTHSRFLRNKAEHDCGAMAVVNSTLTLTGNILSENVSAGDGAALCLEGMAEGSLLSYNTIASNRSEKVALPNIIYLRSGPWPAFVQNNISDNNGYDLVNDSPLMIQAGNNWWGTTDEGAIRARIYNRSLDGRKGDVLISPPLTAPVTVPSDPTCCQQE